MYLRRQSSWRAWPARGAFRAPLAWVLGLSLSCLVLARARAEPEPLVADYSAAGDCPDRTEFERRVRARLSANAPRGRALRFAVRLERTSSGVRGVLQVEGQPGGARELSAASCAEAADALALVAALMLSDPGATARASQTEGARASEAARDARRRSQARDHDEASGADAGASSETPPVAEGAADDAASAPASSQERISSSPPSEVPSVAHDVFPHAVQRRRTRLLGDWRFNGAAGGLFSWGMAPTLRAGVDVWIGASARAHDAGPRMLLAFGARNAFPHRIRIPEGKATFRWLAFTTSFCLEGPERRVRVSGCALLETGWIEASSRDGTTPRERRRFWGALGPTLAASAFFHKNFGVRLSGELLGVLVRDRFFLADRQLYSVPRLAFRAGLSLYWEVW